MIAGTVLSWFSAITNSYCFEFLFQFLVPNANVILRQVFMYLHIELGWPVGYLWLCCLKMIKSYNFHFTIRQKWKKLKKKSVTLHSSTFLIITTECWWPFNLQRGERAIDHNHFSRLQSPPFNNSQLVGNLVPYLATYLVIQPPKSYLQSFW